MGRKRKDPHLADAPPAPPLQARTIQVQLILRLGSKAENPCEFCRLNSEGCIMPPSSSNLSKCAACTRQGRPCIHRFHSESEYRSVLDAHSNLSKELQDLDQSIEASLQAVQQLAAKRRRIERQRDFLTERGTKLLLDDRRLEEDSSDPQPPPVSEDPSRINEQPSCAPGSLPQSDVGLTPPLISSSSVPFSLDSGIPPISSDFALVPDDLLFAFLEDSHIPGSSQGN
jgi:hypothetical protein